MIRRRQRLQALGIIMLLWLITAAVMSMPPAALQQDDGSVVLMSWPRRLGLQVETYGFWMLLTPITAAWIDLVRRRSGSMPITVGAIGAAAYILPVNWLRIHLALPGLLLYSRDPGWQTFTIALPAACLAYGLTLASTLVTEYIRARAELADARLAALRAQLHPHFLFNTLNGIAALTEERPADARAMIARLGDLLRRALDAADHEDVPLTQEVEWIEDYLELQKPRFGDGLTVEFDIDPDALGARVPHLLLQPLVENALRHGLRDGGHSGAVAVSATRDHDSLILRVRDDGAGLSPGGRTGIGLENTRQRLHALFGTAQRLTLSTAGGGGVQVEIVMPYREWRP